MIIARNSGINSNVVFKAKYENSEILNKPVYLKNKNSFLVDVASNDSVEKSDVIGFVVKLLDDNTCFVQRSGVIKLNLIAGKKWLGQNGELLNSIPSNSVVKYLGLSDLQGNFYIDISDNAIVRLLV